MWTVAESSVSDEMVSAYSDAYAAMWRARAPISQGQAVSVEREAIRAGLHAALVAAGNSAAAESLWARRRSATGGGPCGTCGEPLYTHVCLSCSPDAQSPGPGCVNCRNTGMDQTPCLPKERP